jgi:CubicO group peptidase (beta-lactamase class C family)
VQRSAARASATTNRQELGSADTRRRGRASIERERSARVSLRGARLHEVAARARDERPTGDAPPSGSPALEIALGWHIFKTPSGQEIIWHNGGTGGYRSFIGFDPKKRAGVVVLSNRFTNTGVDDIGRHLLDPSSPLIEPAKVRKEIAVDEKVLERYVGTYELAPTFAITITREAITCSRRPPLSRVSRCSPSRSATSS